MDNYLEQGGVFVACDGTPENHQSAWLITCLQALLDAYPSLKFTSINFEQQLNGFKINFSEPRSKEVVESFHLTLSDVRIYSLTSNLTVHGIRRNDVSLQSALRKKLQEKFGIFLSLSRENTSLSYEDWHIIMDIPEYGSLEVFNPENLLLSLPDSLGMFKVTKFCTTCKVNGHFQHECTQRNASAQNAKENRNADAKSSEITDKTAKQTDEIQQPVEEKPIQSSPKNTAGRSESFQKMSQKSIASINSFAERIGREEVLNSGIISGANLNQQEQIQNNESVVSGNILTESEIKKEKDESMETNEGGAKGTPVKEEPHSSCNVEEDSSHGLNYDEDDDIQYIETLKKISEPATPTSRDSNVPERDGAGSSEEGSRSPDKRESFYSTLLQDVQSLANTPSSSRKPSSSKPVSRVEVTTVLSTRLQECINDACDTCKVLDRGQLEAFFTHVKKKSNPIRVALIFTKDDRGLKAQLKQILHLYYSTPQTGTKEDLQFIKWLNGLVDRFDGTIPRKRKRNTDDSNESQNKK